MPACPECGAAWPDGQTCQGIFDEFLAWEFQDPAYGAVHMLTVAVFMIQHGRYSDEGLAWVRRQLQEHLAEGVSLTAIRRAANQAVSQANRAWKVTRPAGAPPPRRIAWEMTIVDVDRIHAESGREAAAYRATVTRWARTTLRQLEAEST